MKKIAVLGSNEKILDFIQGIVSGKKFFLRNFVISIEKTEELQEHKILGLKTLTNHEAAIRNARIIILADDYFDLQKLSNYINFEKQILLNLSNCNSLKKKMLELPSKKTFNIALNPDLDNKESFVFASTICEDKYVLNEVTEFLSVLGKVLYINEDQLESASILNKCASAFIMRFVRSMSLAAVKLGFKGDLSNEIIIKIASSSLKKLDKENSHSETEIDKLIASDLFLIDSLNELENNGFSFSILKGIESAQRNRDKTSSSFLLN
ncbi:MAG: pyrroline-5-carboxylate reductase dimerization domain-containing protein [Bacteroidota bacterium]